MIDGVYLIPHGDELIDLPNRSSKEMREAITKETSKDNADSRIIFTPHGLSLGNKFSVALNERLSGSYLTEGGVNLQMKLNNNLELARLILNSNHDILSKAFFSGGEQNTFPIDFGSLIPLTFFSERPTVIIGQARLWDLQRMHEFGKNIYRAVSSSDKKYSIIFSADQSHTHDPKGPYGFSDEAKIYDETIKDCIITGNFEALYGMRRDFVEAAKPDGYWIMVVLGGFLAESKIKLLLKYYYIERYFGMLFASNLN